MILQIFFSLPSGSAGGAGPKAFGHFPCSPQSLHHQDCSHLDNPPHCVPNAIPKNPNFSVAASCPALPEVVYLGIHHGLSVFLPFTGFTVIHRLQKLKGEVLLYIYFEWGAGPVTAEQLELPRATCEQDLRPRWWAWHSDAGFKGFLGGEGEVSCEALTSAFLLCQVIPFEWSFGARCNFWELRLLKISPSICVAEVCGGIKRISLCWGMCQKGHSGEVESLYLGVSFSQTVSFC